MTPETYIRGQLEAFLKKNNIDDTSVILQRPKEEQFGDFACNIAMQLAKSLRKNPRAIAEEIKQFIEPDPRYIAKVEIAGPGFINFYAAKASLFEQFSEIFNEPDKYGHSAKGKGQKAQIEFVSANPTGPLTIGHGRQAVLGDTIANILEANGYDVTREYYFNNAGRQMRILGQSLQLRYRQQCGEEIEFPEDHYQGAYITDIAKELYQKHGKNLLDSDLQFFSDAAEKAIFEDIKTTVSRLGFEFDVFFNEKTLYEKGHIDEVINGLREKGFVGEREGATWFLTSKLGMDQDRVIVKSTGEPTYRLPDMAYHVEKIKRGFDIVIDVFGADHIDTYPDVLAALDVLGYDKEKIKVLIHQFVTLTDGGQKVKMSTRKANFTTLDELVEEVGVDVTRYFFLMRGMNSHLNFDIKLAKTQSDENPVYYIQYAHARICSILKLAESKALSANHGAEAPFSLLEKTEEINLVKELIRFPEVMEGCAETLEPHKLVNYLFELAGVFHKFYTECRVISDEKELSRMRLSLADATRIVLANGLKILGIGAPQSM